jgi:hypothetical protein
MISIFNVLKLIDQILPKDHGKVHGCKVEDERHKSLHDNFFSVIPPHHIDEDAETLLLEQIGVNLIAIHDINDNFGVDVLIAFVILKGIEHPVKIKAL